VVVLNTCFSESHAKALLEPVDRVADFDARI
jgi:hypothetical protein